MPPRASLFTCQYGLQSAIWNRIEINGDQGKRSGITGDEEMPRGGNTLSHRIGSNGDNGTPQRGIAFSPLTGDAVGGVLLVLFAIGSANGGGPSPAIPCLPPVLRL